MGVSISLQAVNSIHPVFSFILLCVVIGIVVRNTLVTYDREHSKVGFWKTNCSELWERLHISHAPLPMPSAPNGKNSTAEIQPTLAPTEAPHYVLPGT